MEEQKFSFSDSFNKAKEYVDTQLELIKLKSIAKASRIGATIILDSSKLILVLLIIFFVSLSLGFWLGELMESNALGFLTTGIIFFIILLLVNARSGPLEKKFMGLIINRVFTKWNDEVDSKENAGHDSSNDEITGK